MGDTPFGSPVRLSGDLERSFERERERERLEGIFHLVNWIRVDQKELLMVVEHCPWLTATFVIKLPKPQIS